ncbi:putative Aquaporin-2 [Glarea lozoyensis 74030]|uniref:Putative Aquaporin-2 n=1 Tax=Glarea lozoyensis (strain ATCC 74030 / MF5533) TaxID=1104152 RepID=H0EJ27_GLAL7|nr:putative Aquaporin-2 [Glarea lozoyensis 74030]
MNIHKSPTTLSRVDPLKHVFRRIFSALPDGARGTVVAIIGEFLGTLCFIFFAFAGGEVAAASSNKKQNEGVSTGTASKNPALLLYVSLSAGFSLLIFVSLGMALIGAITWVRCAVLTVTQFVATIAASYMVEALFNGGLHVSTELGGDISVAQGVLIEMILTAQLIFTIFMLAAEKHAATFLAPIGIGLSLFIAELVGEDPKP